MVGVGGGVGGVVVNVSVRSNDCTEPGGEGTKTGSSCVYGQLHVFLHTTHMHNQVLVHVGH